MSGVEFSLAGGAGGPFDTMADLGRYLDAVAGAGFTGVSLGLEQLPAAATRPGAVAEVARLVRAAGLTCPDIHALVVGPDDAATLATAARLATIAEAVRARHVLTVLHTPVSAASLDRLGRCARMITGAGATLAVEFAPTRPLDSITAALEAVERHRAGVGWCAHRHLALLPGPEHVGGTSRRCPLPASPMCSSTTPCRPGPGIS